ncbi:hypothetical protein EGJ55_24300, partial [Pseudomonas moraviensis]
PSPSLDDQSRTIAPDGALVEIQGAAEGCDLLILLLLFCGSWLASEGGLTADLFLVDVLDSNCGSEPARESVSTANPLCQIHPVPVGAGLPAKAA